MIEKNKETKQKNKDKLGEEVKFKGKYIKANGRRKTSVAQVRLYKGGKGTIIINNQKLKQYFKYNKVIIVNQPLKLTGHLRDLDFSIIVKGGGEEGQAEAVRHGIVRVLVIFDNSLKEALKARGWITRDSRKKERKKPGLKKARKAPQWSKR